MSVQRKRNVGHVITTSNSHEVIYVVPQEVDYVEVVSLQVARKADATSDTQITARWIDYSDRSVDYHDYWGDGRTVKETYYTYPFYHIIKNALLPNGASLSLLDKNFFLDPNDFIQVKSSTSINLSVSLTLIEYYPDGTEFADVVVDKAAVQTKVGMETPGGTF
jgi:hypothetical protein